MTPRVHWLWRMEHALLHVLGPAQLGNRAEDARRDALRAHADPVAPAELIPGGWTRRGTPGNYYIVRSSQQEDAGTITG